ncbi:MAG: helix-turn-helix transcriptional regulator [Sphingomonadaceae bacterium]
MPPPIPDQLSTLGQRIKARRLALDLTQQAAAERSGVAYRTWRRMEGEGKASIEDLVRAAVALRCEQDLARLFPEPAAASMDELLERQRQAPVKQRQRGRRARL